MGANANQHTPRALHIHEVILKRLSAERAKADFERLERLSRRGPLGILRTAVAGFNRHNCMLWASALTFTLSLSLIPMLAVALSAVKVLIGIDKITPVIKQYVAINSRQLTAQIMQYVGHINAATLGAAGGVTLLITVVVTLSTIEQALNTIFNVAQGRSWIRKFTDYLSITFTVPLLLAIALPLKQDFQSSLPQLPGLGWIVATIPVWAGFSFLYVFFPNRRIKWSCAMLGGLAAAVLLEIGQWAYVRIEVRTGEYQAIYGALAAVPILLMWIYVAWSIILAGAELTAAAQGTEPGFSLDYRTPTFARTAALLTVFRATERTVRRNTQACTIDGLAGELGTAPQALRPIVERLEIAGLVLEISPEASARHCGIFILRDPSELTLAEVLEAIDSPPENINGDERIGSVLRNLAASEQDAFRAITVKDLLEGRFEHRSDVEKGNPP